MQEDDARDTDFIAEASESGGRKELNTVKKHDMRDSGKRKDSEETLHDNIGVELDLPKHESPLDNDGNDAIDSDSYCCSSCECDERLVGYVVCSGDSQCQCPTCRGGETIDPEYWDDLYSLGYRQGDYSEYLLSFNTLKPVLRDIVHGFPFLTEGPTLVPGCGNSPFCVQFHNEFEFSATVCTDISQVAIDVMETQFSELKPDVTFEVDDMLNSIFADDTFVCIADKSFIDCLFWCDDESVDAFELVSTALTEYYRVLQHHGIAIIVTSRSPEEFLPFLTSDCTSDSNPMWFTMTTVIATPVSKSGHVERDVPLSFIGSDSTELNEEDSVHYVYTIQKLGDTNAHDSTQS